jgi:putative transposase
MTETGGDRGPVLLARHPGGDRGPVPLTPPFQDDMLLKWRCFSMPRKPREKSSTGIYHVMVRGVGGQEIFHDNKDRQKYISIMTKYKDICQYELYGYCLMPNHVHLLIKESVQTVSQVMQRMGTSYVYWYNQKYERAGHLFQGRFRSEVVEDDRYLLVVLRYIHQNPTKAGLVETPAAYEWSSYSEYINQQNSLTDVDFILNIFNPDRRKAVAAFKDFMTQGNEDKCLGIAEGKKRPSDKKIRGLLAKHLNAGDTRLLLQVDKAERNKIIKDLKEKDASIRQLARITGLGRRIIEKI